MSGRPVSDGRRPLGDGPNRKVNADIDSARE